MIERRFFLAHAKGDDDARIRDLLETARTAVGRFAREAPYKITTGRDFFDRRFKGAGSWEAWTREVATGIDRATFEPLFHGILVPAGPVGAGTSRIIEHALTARKLVIAFERGGLVATVVGVRCTSQKDWQTGYRLTVNGQFT